MEIQDFKNMVRNLQHTIGYDFGRIKRHQYVAYRNYFSGTNKSMDRAVELGYAKVVSEGEHGKSYIVTKEGILFLTELTRVKIKIGD